MKAFKNNFVSVSAVFAALLIALLLGSCSKRNSTIVGRNESINFNKGNFTVITDNDSSRIYMINFPNTDEYLPDTTEIWYENKLTKERHLIVKSNPDLFGGMAVNNYDNPTYHKYPIDSIPNITKCVPDRWNKSIIVEGITCNAGVMATFRINLKNRDCYVFPSDNGFIGFTRLTDDAIVSSRCCDIDNDLLIWYEKYYIVDTEGNIAKIVDTKDKEIEESLPIVYQDAKLEIDSVKLLQHTRLVPKYKDDSFWANEFKCELTKFDTTTIQKLDSLVSNDPSWTKDNNGYKYFNIVDVENQFKMYVKIHIDPKNHKSVIYKGAYENPLNAPEK